jgi:hypothetical protein
VLLYEPLRSPRPPIATGAADCLLTSSVPPYKYSPATPQLKLLLSSFCAPRPKRHTVLLGRRGEDLLGSPDPSSASDLNASVQAVQDMRIVPIDVVAVIQLVLAAGLPMLAVVTTQIPLGELVKWLVGTIL